MAGRRINATALRAIADQNHEAVDAAAAAGEQRTAHELHMLRAQLAALSRSQAVIEFAPDGTILTANDNFLGAMDYRLDEVVGKHHRMFVDPVHAQQREYVEFWRQQKLLRNLCK